MASTLTSLLPLKPNTTSNASSHQPNNEKTARTNTTRISDPDRCLLSESQLLKLSGADAAGYFELRSNMSGWYRYWYSLHGSQLLYFERPKNQRRASLVGTVSLFRHKMTVINSLKRRREIEITELSGKAHVFRMESDPQFHCWLRLFEKARKITPPANPIDNLNNQQSSSLNGKKNQPSSSSSKDSALSSVSSTLNPLTKRLSLISSAPSPEPAQPSSQAPSSKHPAQTKSQINNDKSSFTLPATIPKTSVDTHLPVDHVLCVVHGIGVDGESISSNTKLLQESYLEIMNKVYPDIQFRIEFLIVHWRDALLQLDIHKKLKSLDPKSPYIDVERINPLKDIIEYRLIDYIYYSHNRYKLYILREICKQLNYQMEQFKKKRPEYNGKISILGHSLGSCLTYELLMKNFLDDQILLQNEHLKLNFQLDNFFCLGSPLATLLLLDPLLNSSQGVIARQGYNHFVNLPFQMTNIFKFQDPIATRIEPFINENWSNIHPVIVPCWTSMGIRESTAQWFGSFWTGNTTTDTNTTNTTTTNGNANANDGSKDDNVDQGLIGNELNNNTNSNSNIKNDNNSNNSTKDATGDDGNVETGKLKNERQLEEVLRGRRLDYGLQISSTMEEMSTSWSAIKSHTEYWGNRDAMLLMITQMLKNSYINDDMNNGESDVVVNEESAIRKMFESSKKATKKDENDGDSEDKKKKSKDNDNKVRSDTNKDKVDVDNANGEGGGAVESEESKLDKGVKKVVDRMMDEAVATHELTRQHPDVRVGSGGGVGQNLMKKRDAEKADKRNAKSGSNDESGEEGDVEKGKEGWASYILSRGWLGGRDKTSSDLSPGSNEPEQTEL